MINKGLKDTTGKWTRRTYTGEWDVLDKGRTVSLCWKILSSVQNAEDKTLGVTKGGWGGEYSESHLGFKRTRTVPECIGWAGVSGLERLEDLVTTGVTSETRSMLTDAEREVEGLTSENTNNKDRTFT